MAIRYKNKLLLLTKNIKKLIIKINEDKLQSELNT